MPNLTAKSVGLEHTELVPIEEISDRVMRGEVIVLPKCMQAIDCFEQLTTASLEGISQVVGEETSARVKAEGFENIHQIIQLDQLTQIMSCSYDIFRSLAPDLSSKVVKAVFKSEKPFYFEADPNVRFHIPYDVAVQRKEEFCRFYWNGKITAHCPHHDSWYDCPTNSVNIWIAVGKVKIGNGLSLYPQVYGKRLPCTEDGKILRNQYFGRALNFELDPGDAIIFHGEHLHSSEINSTAETRHVVSLRLTLSKPKFISKSPYQFIRSHSGADEFMAIFNKLQAKISRRLTKLPLVAQMQAQLSRMALSRQNSSKLVFDDTSNDFPQVLPVEIDETTQDQTRLVFDESKLAIGTIRPISQKLCIARLDKQRIAVFSRSCPHEGADLAAGYLRDGCVVCPWHNLQFNLESGASPCKSLSQLTVYDYVENGDKDETLV